MLKSQLHIHAKEDYKDHIEYSAKKLIDRASSLNFEVLSFTFHDSLFYNEEIKNYAKEKGILLIPGIEKKIEGSHVLILGLEKLPEIRNLKDLEKIKDKALIIAPHPFYPRHYSLGKKLVNNIDLFHAIEFSFFYPKHFNLPNNKAKTMAKKYNKPLIGTSDVHDLRVLDCTYTLVDSKKDTTSFIAAVKKNKVQIVTAPLPLWKIIYTTLRIILRRRF